MAKKKPDARVTLGGKKSDMIFVWPDSQAAKNWVADRVLLDGYQWGNGANFHVEQPYIFNIVQAMRDAGLVVWTEPGLGLQPTQKLPTRANQPPQPPIITEPKLYSTEQVLLMNNDICELYEARGVSRETLREIFAMAAQVIEARGVTLRLYKSRKGVRV